MEGLNRSDLPQSLPTEKQVTLGKSLHNTNIIQENSNSSNKLNNWFISILFKTLCVIELRALGVQKSKYPLVDRFNSNASGYYDNQEKFINNAHSLNGRARGVYFTVNPVSPDLLGRANNKFIERAKHTTKDDEILCRKLIVFDFDPKRPAGTMANDSEVKGIGKVVEVFISDRKNDGWPRPTIVFSGSGYHLYYFFEGECDEKQLKLIYQNFKEKYPGFDETVCNISRIFRLPGTMNCKGDPHKDRVYRRCDALVEGDENTISWEHLKKHILSPPVQEPISPTPISTGNIDKLKAFLDSQGHNIREKREEKRTLLVFEDCIFHPPGHEDHDGHTYECCVTVDDDGKYGGKCQHDSSKTWQHFKKELGYNSSSGRKSSKLNAVAIIVLIEAETELFKDQNNTPYARIKIHGHYEIWPLESSFFEHWCHAIIFEKCGEVPQTSHLTSAIKTICGRVKMQGKKYNLFLRTAQVGNVIWIDLCNDSWAAIKVSKAGVEICDNPPILFKRLPHMEALPEPKTDGNAFDLFQFINIDDKSERLLFLVNVISFFLESISKPIIAISGEKGAAKSTSCMIIKMLVDPSSMPFVTMNEDEKELALNLGQNYTAIFD